MQTVKIFVVLLCIFSLFNGSAESQTTEKKLSKREEKQKSSEIDKNGCGWILATTVQHEKPSDVASFIGYSFNSLFGRKKVIGDYNCSADVTNLILSEIELSFSCPTGRTPCAINKEVAISTEVLNPDNDILTYIYYVSGGKIVGQGSKVVWDLSGEKPGIYTITAGADDVWGSGKTITKEIKISECADCK